MRKRKKPDVGTWYAAFAPGLGWYSEELANDWHRSFRRATLFVSRKDAADSATDSSIVRRIVPVRCRPLTSKKRNPKRTR